MEEIYNYPPNLTSQADQSIQPNEGKGRSKVIFLFFFLYLVSAGVLAYGAYQYGLLKGSQNKETQINQDNQVPVVSETQEPIITASVSAVPTQPTATTKPITTPIPTKASIPNYNYLMPGGWQAVQTTDASFEMGFDPNKDKADVGESPGSIFIEPKDGGSYRSAITLKAYDGGSRHKFIFGTQPITKGDTPDKYIEKEFTYEGKNCLFLENVVISMSPTVWGMCDAGGGKAFWVNTWEKDYLSTVRSLKKLK